MLFDLSLKKAIILLIIVAVIINVTSFYEAKQKQGSDGKTTIVLFYSASLVYLIYTVLSEKNRNKKIAYLTIISLVAIEWIYRAFDLYQKIPDIDLLAHFIGGVALTTSLIKGYNQTKKSTITLNILAAFGWELGEKFFDKIFPIINHDLLRDQFFWDGVVDIILHLFGTVAVLFSLKRLSKV